MIRKLGSKMKQSYRDKQRMKKYKGYHIASTGKDMIRYADYIKTYTSLDVKNIFEIGANYAQDAEMLMLQFGLKPENVWIFEAHPQIVEVINSIHTFHTFHNAVYNENKIMKFHLCDIFSNNSGVSSLRVHSSFQYLEETEVQAIRMDNFMDIHGIEKIDFLKLDVEGCSWEVLDGFGDRLNDVSCVQVEAEHVECWENEKLWEDISSLLSFHNFQLVLFERYKRQSDSLWVQKNILG